MARSTRSGPAARACAGTAFGAALWLVADEIAVPALKPVEAAASVSGTLTVEMKADRSPRPGTPHPIRPMLTRSLAPITREQERAVAAVTPRNALRGRVSDMG